MGDLRVHEGHNDVTNFQLPIASYSASRYPIIPRVLCFVTSGDDLLLLQGAPNKKLWAGKYNGLGGHVERGESVYATARREIREEAGLDVTDLRLRGVVTIDQEAEFGIGLFVFTAKAAGRAVTASAEGALEWVPLNRLSGLDTVEDLPILVRLVFSQAPDAPPFGAHYAYDSDGRLRIELFSDQTGSDQPI